LSLTETQKKEIRKDYPYCYVCKELGVPFSELTGYEGPQIQFDHWLAAGLVGNAQADLQANQRPIHAAPGGKSPLADGWEDSTVRNCHAGKTDRFTGAEWCEYIRINRLARQTRYSDDLLDGRNQKDAGYDVDIQWDEEKQQVRFQGATYPLMIQQVGTDKEQWKSFSTVIPPRFLWTDVEVQPRPVRSERLAEFAWHLRDNPLLTPILCRWSGGRLLVFDGNHRLCAFILARKDHPVPVTVFDGPVPERFLSVASEAHDTLTQLKYQYSEKALKYSALSVQELEKAQEQYGSLASEELAWYGMSRQQSKLRILGRITDRLDEEGGWRMTWASKGLTDQSWNRFLEQYAMPSPERAPFQEEDYLREEEFRNLAFLCRAFDEELFSNLPKAKDSLKTKWWKRSHAVFGRALQQVVKIKLGLPNLPPYPAYTPEWDEYIHTQVRLMVNRWRESPVWREPTTANNEADIDKQLLAQNFTESYLMS
jgi:hypothetical protein